MSLSANRYIVDASIAIKWILDDEDFTVKSRSVLLAYQEGRVDLLAPDHLYHEVLNALRTGVRMQCISERDAVAAMNGFLDLRIQTVTGPPLLQQFTEELA